MIGARVVPVTPTHIIIGDIIITSFRDFIAYTVNHCRVPVASSSIIRSVRVNLDVSREHVYTDYMHQLEGVCNPSSTRKFDDRERSVSDRLCQRVSIVH